MIGSFWNLCRACPSMPVDKQLHSEYRSTYRWHEFTGNSRPEVVRRAPMPNPNQFVGQTNEPSMPRRKKCPELAYKSHEFIIGSEYTDARNHIAANRIARSEERGGTPSRRSKSEGPPAMPNGRAYPIPTDGVDGVATKQAGESNGLFKKTFTKLSTEYRLQFVWPNVRKSIKGPKPNDAAAGAVDHPKKSQSMGAIKAQQQQTMMPTVHKKRTANHKEATLHELEPLVSDAEDRKPHEKQVTIADKKSAHAARPFSQTFDLERNNHFITKKENFGFDEQRAAYEMDNKQAALLNGSAPPHSQPNLELWFKEVVELRKKAGEYKSRGWGVEIDPELYKKQRELWDQVSKRSSLSALSLASSIHRPITKEEKEQENNKKSLPLTPAATTTKPRVPGQAHLIDNRVDEMTALPARFNNIRHHLERTTGPDVEEGALLPSPTREKLMPAITKRESESQRGSPKKTAASRHGSPQKGSPQKGSPKKTLKYDAEDGRETAISISSCSPQPVPEIPDEPIVKSPPEPTRVKSPEQIIMRSPDPVNWTVPLDTGKTFTVTQNVKEGENYSRPQSEIKASTPVEKPPPPPQSAPPELTEQVKMDAWKRNDDNDRKSPTASGAIKAFGKPSAAITTQPMLAQGQGQAQSPTRYDAKPVPGSTLRCLDDPSLIFDADATLATAAAVVAGGSPSSASTSTATATTARSAASDVLEKARDRFDRFWGGNKEDSV